MHKTITMTDNNVTKSGRFTSFMNGVYEPSEAKSIITSIIVDQIKFCEQQYFRQWEADHSTTTDFRDQRVSELKEKCEALCELIDQSNEAGCKVSIEGNFEIKLVK